MERIPRPFPLLVLPETLLLALTALFLCQSKWTGAFAYEFSFFLGIAAVLISAGGSALRLSLLREKRPISPRDPLRAVSANLLSLWAPLVVVLVFSIRIPTCRYDIGLGWFLLLPVVSSLFGSASGIWAQRFKSSPAKTFFLAFVPTLAFSLLTARDLYYGPSLSFLHPAFGYFAGPIYDEWIPIEGPVVTFRLFTILLSFWLMAVSLWKSPRWIPATFALIVFGLLVAREPIGWFHGATSLEAALSHHVKSERIDLRYAPGSLSEVKALKLTRDLDARAARIAQEIGLRKDAEKPVMICLYPDPKTKRRLTGTRYTAIGNPIARAVHALATDPPELLTHELAHVISGPLGVPGLGLPLRVSLLEGLATAVERYRDDLSVHEWARAMQRLHLLPKMEKLFGPLGFWSQAASRAYLAAGSFSRWLIDTRGIFSFQQIYRGRSFETAYEVSLKELILEWEDYLQTIRLSKSAVQIAEAQLLKKPISERRCPHDVADATEEGFDCWAKRDTEGAVEAFDRAWNYSGGMASTTLRLARAEIRARNWERAKFLANEVLNDPESFTAEKTTAHLLLGDVAVATGNNRQALSEYSRPRKEELEENLRLLLLTRIELLEVSRLPELKDLTQNGAGRIWASSLLLVPKDSDLEAAFLLAAKKELEEGEIGLAARLFARAKTPGSSSLEMVRLKLEAKLQENQGDFVSSRRTYGIIRSRGTTEGVRIYAEEQLAR